MSWMAKHRPSVMGSLLFRPEYSHNVVNTLGAVDVQPYSSTTRRSTRPGTSHRLNVC